MDQESSLSAKMFLRYSLFYQQNIEVDCSKHSIPEAIVKTATASVPGSYQPGESIS
jgi:hypothetical protein